MASYVVDAANANSPTDVQGAKQGAEEFRALKLRVNTLGAAVGGTIGTFKNRIYNSSWRFDQINEGALYTAAAGIFNAVDGWSTILVGAGVFKLRRLVDTTRFLPNNSGFILEVTCTTADAAIAAGDEYAIDHAIEGYDVADLLSGTSGAKQITIRFPMNFSVVGTYGVAIRNSAADRTYIGTVTQNVAGADEVKTVTLTLDTAGTWLKTNGVGLQVSFCLAAGTTYQATAGSWQAGNFLTTSAQVNFMSNIANTGYIGRIQLEKGAVATEFEELSIQQDLARCQRYYWKTFAQGTAVAQAAGRVGAISYRAVVTGVGPFGCVMTYFPVEQRANGTITYYSPDVASANWRNIGVGESGAATSEGTPSPHRIAILNTQVAGDNAGALLQIHATVNSRLS